MVDGLAIAALVVSVASAAGTAIGVRHAKRSARASERSAQAAEAVDRRARTPRLTIVLDHPEPAPNDRVIYRLCNDGPQDLDSIVVFRPRPPDRITYPIAWTGRSNGWVDDEVDIGPLTLGQETRITLCCGVAQDLPEFRVRIECRAGTDSWTLLETLPPPRMSSEGGCS